MNKLKILIALLITLVLFGCASKPRGSVFVPGAVEANASQALIYIYNDNKFIKDAYSWVLADNGKKLALISNNTYFAYVAPPGELRFSADLRVTPSDVRKSLFYFPASLSDVAFDLVAAVEAAHTNKQENFEPLHTINVEAGRTYYLKWKSKLGGPYKPVPYLVEVDESIGEQDLVGNLLAGPP